MARTTPAGLARLLIAPLVGVGMLLPAWGVLGQVEALRNKDDQFIQALRDQGMADLLNRFVEVAPPEDPIARLNLEIAQKEFLAEDTWARSDERFRAGLPEEAIALREQSRVAYEGVMKAQRQIIDGFPEDERMPIWETDLAQMILGTYLTRYQNSAATYYEFGIPSADQKKAFEDYVVTALEMTSDATRRLDLLANRIGSEPELRNKLEELGIWFKIQDQYSKKLTPFWYGHACHYAALLPDDHPYYKALGANLLVRGQKLDIAGERDRLREIGLGAMRGELMQNAQSKPTAQLISGSILARKGSRDEADQGIGRFLDPLINAGAGSWEGYLATLAKAVGRKTAGEMNIALDILSGIENNTFVEQDGGIHSRLIAADLMFRMLNEEAAKAPARQRAQKISDAYTRAYLPLINDPSNRFAPFLYQRWAAQMEQGVEPSSLPEMVRMGVGERLTGEGSGIAQNLMFIGQNAPADLPNHRADFEKAKDLLSRGENFNQSLLGEDVEPDVRARALYNLGYDYFFLAKLGELFEGMDDATPYIKVAQTWGRIGVEIPDAPQAEEATANALSFLQNFDHILNNGEFGVKRQDVRDSYRAVADAMFENWPGNEAAHNNRSYAGAYIYEKAGELEKAIEVYRGCPRDHRTYFECGTQLMWVLRRQYRDMYEEAQFMEQAPPEGLDADEQAVFDRKLAGLKEELDRVRRELLADAENLQADAELAMQKNENPHRTFTAATAFGAAKVIGALMLGDDGQIDEALARLEGFEDMFRPDGNFGPLLAAQPNPENAEANLVGLVRIALESRILVLVRGERLNQVAPQARQMMDAFPDSAAGVINGVLDKLQHDIDQQVRIRDASRLDLLREEAQARVVARANVAVELGELMGEWARGRGFEGPQLLGFDRALARALMLADRPDDAAGVIAPWLEQYPNEPNLAMLAGDIYFAAAKKKGKNPGDYDLAQQQYNKIINAFNARPEKPPIYWRAWLESMRILDHVGGERAGDIPGKILKLKNFDERLGGEHYDEFMALHDKHLGG